MKTFPLSFFAWCALGTLAQAADGTWNTSTGATAQSWSNTAYWAGGTVASGTNATATFQYYTAGGSGAAYDSTINVDAATTIGNITAAGTGSGSTHNITINGPSALTLVTNTGSAPTITANLGNGRALTINAALSGSNGLVLQNISTGSLVVGGANTYSGTTWLPNGNVVLNSSSALGSSANVIVSSSAALELGNGVTISGKTLNLAGAGGPSFLGAIHTATNAVATWTGDINLDTSARIGARGASSVLTLSGAISDGGAGRSVAFSYGTDSDPQGTVLLSGASTYTGTTTIYRGTVKLDGGNNRLPTSTLVVMGATNSDSLLDLNGRQQQIAGLANDTGNSSTRMVTNTSGAAAVLTLNGSTDQTFLGDANDTTVISGKLSVVKAGSSAQTLAKTNNYSGNTTINAGTLLLADDATMAFYIGSNGVNNSVSGTGAFNIAGDFVFNLTSAELAAGNSWNIVNVATLGETFAGTFTVQGFAESTPGVWTSGSLSFSEATGVLSVVPEPSVPMLLAGGLGILRLFRRRAGSGDL